MEQLSLTPPSPVASQNARANSRLSQGQQLESVFLAEMLKATGLGKTPDGFGGGAGEDQFASFLRDAHAREMVRAGGLGLAHYFEQVIEGRSNGA